jgi:methylglutaconyl-CoA hydratase
VSRKIGITAFTQLSLDSKTWKPASWATEKGLYSHLSEDTKALDATLNKKAMLFASYAPEACKALRELHWKNTDHWEKLLPKNAETTAKLALSDFTQNFIKSL